MNIPGYDAWRLAGPDEQQEIGTEDGETCGRYPEPDEDQPIRYRARPCGGLMVKMGDDVACESCGEQADA